MQLCVFTCLFSSHTLDHRSYSCGGVRLAFMRRERWRVGCEAGANRALNDCERRTNRA